MKMKIENPDHLLTHQLICQSKNSQLNAAQLIFLLTLIHSIHSAIMTPKSVIARLILAVALCLIIIKTATGCFGRRRGKFTFISYCDFLSECQKNNGLVWPSFSVNCRWGPWGKWSICIPNGQAGRQAGEWAGRMKAIRKIVQAAANGGKKCVGQAIKFKDCTGKSAVDCQWGAWSRTWSTCSVAWAPGQMTATREIVQEAKNGGRSCTGGSIKIKSCTGNSCSSNLKIRFLT